MMTSSGNTVSNVHLHDLEQVHGPLFRLWKKTEGEGAWSTKRTAMISTILFTTADSQSSAVSGKQAAM